MQDNPNEQSTAAEAESLLQSNASPAVQEAVTEHSPAPAPSPELAPVKPQQREPASEEPAKPKKEKRVPDTSVMKVRSYMGALFLLMIPLVNLIMMFKWSFSRGINRNKRNLGLAALFLLLLFIAIFVGACVLAQTQLGFDLPAYLWNLIVGSPIV